MEKRGGEWGVGPVVGVGPLEGVGPVEGVGRGGLEREGKEEVTKSGSAP